MLVTTRRLYERVQLGLKSTESGCRDAAESCLSYFILVLRQETVVLPPEVVERYKRLPGAFE